MTDRRRMSCSEHAETDTGSTAQATMKAPKKPRAEPAPIGERLLTIREAADVLRLHPRTVREYIRRGELKGRLLGGRWRFRRKDLDAFYENAPSQWDFQGKDEHEG